jgi:uncharacterized membrane protein YgaE (UPF0421/DUF939 family)
MHHIGMRVYMTAIAIFFSSLLAQSTTSRDKVRPKKTLL